MTDAETLRYGGLVLATIVAETIGSLVGGGSFITQPAVLLAGFSMRQAIALDVTASCLTSVTGLATLRRAGRIPPLRIVLPPAIAGAAGAALGPRIMVALPVVALAWMFAASALLVVAMTARPMRREADEPRAFGLVASGLVLGVYTGLSGAGSGVLAIALLCRLGGMSTIGAVAVRKFVFIPATVVAAVAYAAGGNLAWGPLVPMTLACALAGWVGTRLMLRIGDLGMAWVVRYAALAFAVATVWKAVRG